MNITKKILIIIWAILTVGLIIYSQAMKAEAERKSVFYNEALEVMKDMSETHVEYYENMLLLRNDTLNKIDIDSLFENSFFLQAYEEKSNNLIK